MADIQEVKLGLDEIVARLQAITNKRPLDPDLFNLALEVLHVANSVRDLVAIVQSE